LHIKFYYFRLKIDYHNVLHIFMFQNKDNTFNKSIDISIDDMINWHEYPMVSILELCKSKKYDIHISE